jgi:hypothetical protein
MDEELSGLEPGKAAAAQDGGLAERLMREEFSEATATHRVRGHREITTGAPSLGEHSTEPVTAKVPAVTAETAAGDDTMLLSGPAIHQEFAQPRATRRRSHRAGMLAGLGVVAVLLAVLVVLAPGGSKPHLPAQSVHDVSPISSSGPKTAAATAPSTAPSTPTSSAAASTTTTAPQPHETISTFITYSYAPGTTTPAPTPTPTTAAPAETAAPLDTTTTTAPPETTTTTTKPCRILGLLQC